MPVLQITIRVAWSLAIAIVAGAILIIFHVFDIHPEHRLAFAVLGVIADPKLLEVLQWGAVAVVALVSAGIYNVVAWRLSKRPVAAVDIERTPITDLRDWAVEAGWDADIYSNTVGENDFWTFKTRLEQAAVDGGIEFWGRKYRYGIPEDIKDSERLIKIGPSHFEEFGLDVQDLAQSKNYDILTHKSDSNPGQSRDQCFRDLHINAAQARAWLKGEGKAPPAASFNVQLVAGPGQIGDYNCVFAVNIKNIESNELKNCLVQMEQTSITHPDQMPMPLILRTDGQIRNSRKGRFTLSPNQPTSIPVLFRNRTRNNEWFFFDDGGRSYFTSAQHAKFVLGIYGGKSSGKALIDVLVGDDWAAYPSLKIVSNDFTLSETAEIGLIPLHEAARLAYEENRHTIGVKLEDRLDKGPKRMIGSFAEMLVRDESVAIFGVYPPSKKLEQIPHEDARAFQIADDAKQMSDAVDGERMYCDLAIKRKDVKRRLGEIKTEYGA